MTSASIHAILQEYQRENPITTTPNTVGELLNLQGNSKTHSVEELVEMIGELSGEEASNLVFQLTKRLASFHWRRHSEIREAGDPDDQQTAWCHDATLWSNIAIMMANISDIDDDDD